jgi:hypothetical protein
MGEPQVASGASVVLEVLHEPPIATVGPVPPPALRLARVAQS